MNDLEEQLARPGIEDENGTVDGFGREVACTRKGGKEGGKEEEGR